MYDSPFSAKQVIILLDYTKSITFNTNQDLFFLLHHSFLHGYFLSIVQSVMNLRPANFNLKIPMSACQSIIYNSFTDGVDRQGCKRACFLLTQCSASYFQGYSKSSKFIILTFLFICPSTHDSVLFHHIICSR